MHTAQQLKSEYFTVEIDGHASDPYDVFPSWNLFDRLGVVVTEPLGGVGASLLLQVAVTAYYDSSPVRRDTPMYPEIHIFHVGAMHGSFSWYDVFPERKEVLVPNDPAVILEELNTRGITRLAVPDGSVTPVDHFYKEPASATERIVSSFAYSPSGRVRGADIQITANNKRAVSNTNMTLNHGKDYAKMLGELSQHEEFANGVPRLLPGEKLQEFGTRDEEVPFETKVRISEQRKELEVDGFPRESYRRIELADALFMLTNGFAA
jgi:hypothetical protein